MSGTQWIYLQGIDCFELLAIGIPVQRDNGRQNRALCLWGSATKRVERLCGEALGEGIPLKKKNRGGNRGRHRTMGVGPVTLSSRHVNSDSNTQKTMLHCIFCYVLWIFNSSQLVSHLKKPKVEGRKRDRHLYPSDTSGQILWELCSTAWWR